MFNSQIKLLILSYYNVKFILNITKIHNNIINYKKPNNIIKFLFFKKKINKIQINYNNTYFNFINFLLKDKSIKIYNQLYLNSICKNLYLTKKKLHTIHNFKKLNYKFNNKIININKKYYINLNINQYKKNYLYIYLIKNKFIFKLDKFILNLYYKKKKLYKKKIINLYKIPSTYKKFLISVKNTHIYKLFKYNNLFFFYLNIMLNNFFFIY